jgi:hypothetical protein
MNDESERMYDFRLGKIARMQCSELRFSPYSTLIFIVAMQFSLSLVAAMKVVCSYTPFIYTYIHIYVLAHTFAA